MSTRDRGDRGEQLALNYLRDKGYTPVERNYRTRWGELDLIMRDGESLVFVEVKLRSGTGFGDPVEAVDDRKQARVRAMAEQYLAERAPQFNEARFDVVGILQKSGTHIRHIENAF